MIAITDDALGLLQAGHVLESRMARELVIGWTTDATIKIQTERFGDQYERPSEGERWCLIIGDYGDESRIATRARRVAPGIYVRFDAEESPRFPGGTIDVANGRLVLKLHAA